MRLSFKLGFKTVQKRIWYARFKRNSAIFLVLLFTFNLINNWYKRSYKKRDKNVTKQRWRSYDRQFSYVFNCTKTTTTPSLTCVVCLWVSKSYTVLTLMDTHTHAHTAGSSRDSCIKHGEYIDKMLVSTEFTFDCNRWCCVPCFRIYSSKFEIMSSKGSSFPSFLCITKTIYSSHNLGVLYKEWSDTLSTMLMKNVLISFCAIIIIVKSFCPSFLTLS